MLERQNRPSLNWYYNALGKPQQNGLTERFNGELHDELLIDEMSDSFGRTKRALSLWRHNFHNARSRIEIGRLAPAVRRTFSQCGSNISGPLAKPSTWQYQQVGL